MKLKHIAVLGLALALAGGVMAAGNNSTVLADSAFPLEVGATAKSIKLEWDPIEGATGYEVWRKDSVTGEYKLLGGVADINHPLYFDAPLEAGHYYYYRVVVHIEGGEDLESETDHETDLVAINEENFPDEAWRNYVLTEIDWDHSGGLSRNEIADTYSISTNDLDIKDFKGIEYFTDLESISVTKAKNITSLDLSSFTKLDSISIQNCGLESLDGIILNTNITTLNLHYNKIASFDPTAFTKLKKLILSSNKLTSLNITGLTDITELNISNNGIGSIDVSGLTKLTDLSVSNNPIKDLNVTGCTNLLFLRCSTCELTSLDLSHNAALMNVHCDRNSITSLDVSHNAAITWLDCKENLIEELKLSPTAKYGVLCVNQNLIPLDEVPALADEYDFDNKYPQRYMTPKFIEQLKVTAENSTSISLEWEVIDNASGYQVWRGTSVNDKNPVKIQELEGKDSTTFTNTGLTTGKSYYYYVIPYTVTEIGDEEYTYTSEDYFCYFDGATHTYHKGVTGTAKATFDVIIAETEHGTITVNKTNPVAPNTLVTVTVTPDTGYKCTGRTATTKSGQNVNIADNNVFTMPSEDVTVTAAFEKEEYDVSVVYDGRIIFVTGIDDFGSGYYGDTYEFKVGIVPELADEWEIVYVEANDETLLPDADGYYHATQPAKNLFITIVADFKDEGPIAEDGWFVQDDGSKIYIEGGEPVKGWKTIDGKKYYFNSKTGVMATGWKTFSNGKTYYFAKSTGAAVKGLKELGGKYYYFDKNCVMQSGWQTISSKKYYFKLNSDKTRAPAYVDCGKKIGSYYYLFNSKGVMQKSGVKSDSKGNSYYLKSDGKAYTKKWYKKSGKYYYFGSNGKMVKNTSLKIGKKTYKFDKKGVCKNP